MKKSYLLVLFSTLHLFLIAGGCNVYLRVSSKNISGADLLFNCHTCDTLSLNILPIDTLMIDLVREGQGGCMDVVFGKDWYINDSLISSWANYKNVKCMPTEGLYKVYHINPDINGWYYINVHLSLTAVEQTHIENTFKIYPNPCHEKINISTKSKLNEVKILDIKGSTILKTTNTEIDVSQYPPGLYFIQLTTEAGETKTEKLIIE